MTFKCVLFFPLKFQNQNQRPSSFHTRHIVDTGEISATRNCESEEANGGTKAADGARNGGD